MKLEHITVLPHKEQISIGKPTLIRDFNKGWEMSEYVTGLKQKCQKIKNDKTIYWHSTHLRVLLWLEDEKYLTLLELV